MTTTSMKGVIRQMLALDPALGRSEAVASLAAQSVTVTALGTGGSSQRFVNEWPTRFDTATNADRIRRCSAFTASSGALAHTGTAYGDTTSTGEVLDILVHEPYLYLNAVQVTLARLKQNDRTIIPTLQNQDTAWLADLSWIEQPSDILRVVWSNNPVMTRNRFFQKYSSYNTSGVLAPDFWTLTGASATMARSATHVRRGLPSSLKITRSGTDCYITQTPGLLENGVTTEDLKADTVTAVFWAWASVASQVRVTIYDGVTTTNGSFHTGGSGWEELTATVAIGATATTVEARLNVITDNADVWASEGYALEGSATTDEVRRDNYDETDEQRGVWEQNGGLSATLPMRSRKGQWVVWSQRGFPQLDATRFAAGTADADTIDAPVVAMATGAIARLYESLAEMSPENGPKYGPLAALWTERFGSMALKHISPDPGPRPLGALWDRMQPLSRPARRYG